jgi:hypothetical protein
VFDRTADGRVLKCLTIVDDATSEAVRSSQRVPSVGFPVTRVCDRLAVERGLPRVLRTDNALEFCGRTMLTWAHDRDGTRRLTNRASPRRTPISSPSTAACASGVPFLKDQP